MIVAGFMSAFINNVGVAALLLPVIMDLARRLSIPPSKLLMPLAYATLLGGLTTLIGTPPNILINGLMLDLGLDSFGFFEFAYVGLPILLVGIVFMGLIGIRLLPRRDLEKNSVPSQDNNLDEIYSFDERLFVLKIPSLSPLDGKLLNESRLGASLGLNVIAIKRHGDTLLAPGPMTPLISGDNLIVEGRLELLDNLQKCRQFELASEDLTVQRLISANVQLAEVEVDRSSKLVGKTLLESDFRHQYGVNVLAIMREDSAQRTNLQGVVLQAGCKLLVQGSTEQLAQLESGSDWSAYQSLTYEDAEAAYALNERLQILQVPKGSNLIGSSLAENRLADAYGISVLGIIRDDNLNLMPQPDERISDKDLLLVEVWPRDLEVIQGLKTLEVDLENILDLKDLQSNQIGVLEVVLSPHSTLAGKTLREIHFREKFGLSVLAIWHGGRAYRSNQRDISLRFGDALLVYGPKDKFRVLGAEPDFLVLTEEAQKPMRLEKAPLAALIMFAVVVPVIFGWLPIAISAVAGATLMVVTGCLTMEEAYQAIEWKVVFLIAGMLPLGIALQATGTAEFIASRVVELVGGSGEMAILASVFGLTAIASQIMPNAAVIVLMAPIALNTANEVGISVYSMAILVAIAASASFMSPISHPSNSLVMGPGGYRFSDFIKVGALLTLIVMLVTLLVLPFFWPL
jgi:di/tricarboxylate transporter